MTEPVTPRRLTSGVPEFVRRDHSGCRQPTEPICYEHPFTGPDLSPAEAATVARFDAAPDAEESLRERVARALYVAHRDPEEFWTVRWQHAYAMHDEYRRLADAAIAVIRGDDA